MRVGIVGTGYVGLTTGASLAEIGHDVLCVDIDEKKIAVLERGEIPFYEPGLRELVTENVARGRLRFSSTVGEAYTRPIVFCAVGTPSREDGSADLRAVTAVADAFSAAAGEGAVLVIKSTVPPGTVDGLVVRIGKAVVANPEFLREGSAVKDALHPDRLVVGAADEAARQTMRELYVPFLDRRVSVVETNARSAEVIKYASNAFLATKISFINEVANFCDAVGADVKAVAHGMGLDPRIGSEFLRPGVGYGGSCFPKDVRALIAAGTSAQADFCILPVVERINQRQRERLYERLLRELDGSVVGKRIALWGLAFKPHTDDIREAPAMYFVERLLKEGADVVAYDPAAMESARRVFPAATYAPTAREALRDADALVLLTEWPEFFDIPHVEIVGFMRGEIVIRGR